MGVFNLKNIVLPFLVLASFEAFSSQAPSEIAPGDQIVNLNLHIKSRHTNSKSSLAMPFYQTAELERKIDNKNVLIELNPKRGKNSDEVAIEMKFYKSGGSKAFYKKEVIAKLNRESKISYRGTTFRVTPVLN